MTQQLLAVAAGTLAATAAASSHYHMEGILNAAVIGSMAITIMTIGYNKDFEREADSMAALYFDIHRKDKNNLMAIFKKLQFINLRLGLHPNIKNRSHPDLRERIDRAKRTRFLYFGKEKSYVFKREEKPPIQLDLICQRIYGKEHKIDIYINDRSLLHVFHNPQGKVITSLSIKNNNVSHEFTLNDNFVTEDVWGAYLTFKKEGREFLQDIKTVTLSVKLIPDNGNAHLKEEQNFRFVEGKIQF